MNPLITALGIQIQKSSISLKSPPFLLCLSGTLIHTATDSGVESWDLVRDWDERTLYLCMDGLSLDRHRSFKKN